MWRRLRSLSSSTSSPFAPLSTAASSIRRRAPGSFEAAIAEFRALGAQPRTDVLVLGDSRIYSGLDPAAASAASGSLRFLNGGVPGTTPRCWPFFVRAIDPRQRPSSRGRHCGRHVCRRRQRDRKPRRRRPPARSAVRRFPDASCATFLSWRVRSPIRASASNTESISSGAVRSCATISKPSPPIPRRASPSSRRPRRRRPTIRSPRIRAANRWPACASTLQRTRSSIRRVCRRINATRLRRKCSTVPEPSPSYALYRRAMARTDRRALRSRGRTGLLRADSDASGAPECIADAKRFATRDCTRARRASDPAQHRTWRSNAPNSSPTKITSIAPEVCALADCWGATSRASARQIGRSRTAAIPANPASPPPGLGARASRRTPGTAAHRNRHPAAFSVVRVLALRSDRCGALLRFAAARRSLRALDRELLLLRSLERVVRALLVDPDRERFSHRARART